MNYISNVCMYLCLKYMHVYNECSSHLPPSPENTPRINSVIINQHGIDEMKCVILKLGHFPALQTQISKCNSGPDDSLSFF